MTDDARSGRRIEQEIEVPGTPDEVWAAIATGPGISSWYVPHEVEEREGGAISMSFGPGMEGTGRVSAWDPPNRVVFEGNEGEPGLAFEWIVEARDGASCIVRLVNSGFGDGEEWDAQYDGMSEGWPMFLHNLELHLRHFRGQQAIPSLPMALWSTAREEAWPHLTSRLGLPTLPAVGDRVAVEHGPPLAGVVTNAADSRLSLLVDEPSPATAFLAVEGYGDQVGVSVWIYHYGDTAESAATEAAAAWTDWLAANAP